MRIRGSPAPSRAQVAPQGARGSSSQWTRDRALIRTKGSTTTSFTYQGISESVAKTINGSTTTTYASTRGGAPLAERTGSVASFHLCDTHGDVVGLASTLAANQGTTVFDPWGGSLATTGQTSFLGYQGDITDPDTKQVDMGTRWYAAGLGRFTARDMIFGQEMSPMTLNMHVYGGLNPVTMWDPTGMYQDDGGGGDGCGLDPTPACAEALQQHSENREKNGPSICPSCFSPTPPAPEPPTVTGVFTDFPICGKAGCPTHSDEDACLILCKIFDWFFCAQAWAFRTWATVAGGHHCVRQAEAWVCTPTGRRFSLGTGANAWVNNMTIGDTIVSDEPMLADEYRHELGHVEQGREMGPYYLPGYGVSEVIGRIQEPLSSDCNPMEIDAGPGGAYGQCRPWWSS
jgi:RHS repeat-associated protein